MVLLDVEVADVAAAVAAVEVVAAVLEEAAVLAVALALAEALLETAPNWASVR